MANSSVIHMNSASVSPEYLADKGVVFVDFWAPWCSPCRMVAPIIDQLAEEFKGEAIVGKVNIDENEDAAVRYGVASIPTMIVFKDGQEAERIVGARPRPQLAEIIRRHL